MVEFDGLPRMELKRDLGDDSPVKEPARSVDPRPLFEKYQFLTPGEFAPTTFLKRAFISGILMRHRYLHGPRSKLASSGHSERGTECYL